MTDQELLRAFVERRDERAFGQIVERYLRLVYAAARRQVGGDAHAAEDVAQAVFIILARKAATVRDGTMLAGWLVSTARLVAKSAARGEARRRRHVQRVADMTSRSQSNPAAPGNDDDDDLQLMLVDRNLDDALARLGEADRTAVTLRYLQGMSMREVAEAMGTSEPAANKRVTRAVAKLRELFRRRGLMIAPTMLTTSLLRQAEVVLPQQVSGPAIAAAALEAARVGAAGATAAGALAHAVIASAAMSRLAAVAAALAALLLLGSLMALGASTYFRDRSTGTRLVDATAPASPALSGAATTGAVARTAGTVPSAAGAPRGPVKVGVYVSFRTGTAKATATGQRNWQQQFRIAEEMRDASLELIPLVEPGTERDPDMATRLTGAFGNKPVVDVTRVEELRKLDVIVAASVCYPTDAALAAIDAAVHDGTGLIVRQCLGGDDNGYLRPVVRRLRLLDDAAADALLPVRDSDATVVGNHPLLGRLAEQPNRTIKIRTFGGYGSPAPGSTPLLVLRDTSGLVFFTDRSRVQPRPGYVVCPLSIGQVGKGRVVSCSFGAAQNQLPPELEAATSGGFMTRAARWAAGRAID